MRRRCALTKGRNELAARTKTRLSMKYHLQGATFEGPRRSLFCEGVMGLARNVWALGLIAMVGGYAACGGGSADVPDAGTGGSAGAGGSGGAGTGGSGGAGTGGTAG